mmetsp:Transcript_22310/g.37984  ORF Transcript_22310/g.37984 Transcript_22310/m.37984 type:complete len:81 (-) Transcript_22310:76-318(-)
MCIRSAINPGVRFGNSNSADIVAVAVADADADDDSVFRSESMSAMAAATMDFDDECDDAVVEDRSGGGSQLVCPVEGLAK